jgi:DNA polymerase I-like protein with 3'-5' exonuclease and polymerase domains
VAKVPTLGISYGLTPFGFVRQVQNELEINYEIHEAPGFFKTFFEMFPQIAAYHARAAEDALSLDRCLHYRRNPALASSTYG